VAGVTAAWERAAMRVLCRRRQVNWRLAELALALF
jgi:hypothetical protein